jgi:hypothetical protein
LGIEISDSLYVIGFVHVHLVKFFRATRIWERDHAHRNILRTLLLLLLALLGYQVSQREIVHYILHILDPVLQPVAAAAQAVVLEVEDLETRVQVLDELVDEKRTLIITESDGITCEACLPLLALMKGGYEQGDQPVPRRVS